ncbi:hypothetical protein MRX96_007614 [Rhipicephalus microplus]
MTSQKVASWSRGDRVRLQLRMASANEHHLGAPRPTRKRRHNCVTTRQRLVKVSRIPEDPTMPRWLELRGRRRAHVRPKIAAARGGSETSRRPSSWANPGARLRSSRGSAAGTLEAQFSWGVA